MCKFKFQIFPAYCLMCNNINVCAMAQMVSRGFLTAENRFRYQRHSVWDLCWTKWQWSRCLSEYLVFTFIFRWPCISV